MRRLFIIPILLICAQARAQADYVSDDAGKSTGAIWTEVSATKVLPYDLSIGLDAGFRTNDWFNEASRVDIGLSLAWKPSKHWKFGLGYTFIMKHAAEETAHKTEWKYRATGASENTDFASFMGAPTYTAVDATTYRFRGYNDATRITEAYWRPRHRLNIDGAYTCKFWQVLRLTLRERYQLSFVPTKEVNRTRQVTKYREPSYDIEGNLMGYDEVIRYWQADESIYALDLNDDSATPQDVTSSYLAEHNQEWLNTNKEKNGKTLHTLRSRLTLEIDKKGWAFTPYVYAEVFNDMADGFHADKVRASAGVEYNVTKQHRLQLGYIFNHEDDDDGDHNIHAINIGYKLKF